MLRREFKIFSYIKIGVFSLIESSDLKRIKEGKKANNAGGELKIDEEESTISVLTGKCRESNIILGKIPNKTVKKAKGSKIKNSRLIKSCTFFKYDDSIPKEQKQIK